MYPEVTKLNNIINTQRKTLIKRDEEIKGVWLTLLSGEHGFFYGPPGVAKSMLVEDVARYFPEFNYFFHLMGKTTVPEELFGPVSITQLKQDKYEHKTEGYIPDAEICFIDEAFKAGATILNTLLRIMNERKFRNGTEMLNIPLRSMFAASNEIPLDSELGALYDRFLFRFNVQDLQYAEDFETLLKNEGSIKDFLSNDPVEKFTTEEFTTLTDSVASVTISDDLLGTIVDIRESLKLEHQITASSRRWLKSLKGIRAHAVMHGRDEAEEIDLTCLTQILWDRPEEIDKITEIIWKHANPGEYMCRKHRERIDMLMTDMEDAFKKTNPKEKDLILSEYRSKINNEIEFVNLSRDSLSPDQRKSMSDKFNYMLRVLESSKITLMVNVGDIDKSAVSQSVVPWNPEELERL